MREAKSTLNDERPYIDGLAWHSTLDSRYLCEVQRDKPYRGTLCIFDADTNNSLIYSEAVIISYDARFGPDVQDVSDWQDMCADFIDRNQGSK